jgi:hypothetical protein
MYLDQLEANRQQQQQKSKMIVATTSSPVPSLHNAVLGEDGELSKEIQESVATSSSQPLANQEESVAPSDTTATTATNITTRPAPSPIPPIPHIKTTVIDGVDCSFFEEVSTLNQFGSRNRQTLGALLYSFFHFYAFEFPYSTHVGSVRHGRLLTKKEKGWDMEVERHCRFLCVEEPMTPQRNLGNSADAVAVMGLRGEFLRALEVLKRTGGSLEAVCEAFVMKNAGNGSGASVSVDSSPVLRAQGGSGGSKNWNSHHHRNQNHHSDEPFLHLPPHLHANGISKTKRGKPNREGSRDGSSNVGAHHHHYHHHQHQHQHQHHHYTAAAAAAAAAGLLQLGHVANVPPGVLQQYYLGGQHPHHINLSSLFHHSQQQHQHASSQKEKIKGNGVQHHHQGHERSRSGPAGMLNLGSAVASGNASGRRTASPMSGDRRGADIRRSFSSSVGGWIGEGEAGSEFEEGEDARSQVLSDNDDEVEAVRGGDVVEELADADASDDRIEGGEDNVSALKRLSISSTAAGKNLHGGGGSRAKAKTVDSSSNNNQNNQNNNNGSSSKQSKRRTLSTPLSLITTGGWSRHHSSSSTSSSNLPPHSPSFYHAPLSAGVSSVYSDTGSGLVSPSPSVGSSSSSSYPYAYYPHPHHPHPHALPHHYHTNVMRNYSFRDAVPSSPSSTSVGSPSYDPILGPTSEDYFTLGGGNGGGDADSLSSPTVPYGYAAYGYAFPLPVGMSPAVLGSPKSGRRYHNHNHSQQNAHYNHGGGSGGNGRGGEASNHNQRGDPRGRGGTNNNNGNNQPQQQHPPQKMTRSSSMQSNASRNSLSVSYNGNTHGSLSPKPGHSRQKKQAGGGNQSSSSSSSPSSSRARSYSNSTNISILSTGTAGSMGSGSHLAAGGLPAGWGLPLPLPVAMPLPVPVPYMSGHNAHTAGDMGGFGVGVDMERTPTEASERSSYAGDGVDDESGMMVVGASGDIEIEGVEDEAAAAGRKGKQQSRKNADVEAGRDEALEEDEDPVTPKVAYRNLDGSPAHSQTQHHGHQKHQHNHHSNQQQQHQRRKRQPSSPAPLSPGSFWTAGSEPPYPSSMVVGNAAGNLNLGALLSSQAAAVGAPGYPPYPAYLLPHPHPAAYAPVPYAPVPLSPRKRNSYSQHHQHHPSHNNHSNNNNTKTNNRHQRAKSTGESNGHAASSSAAGHSSSPSHSGHHSKSPSPSSLSHEGNPNMVPTSTSNSSSSASSSSLSRSLSSSNNNHASRKRTPLSNGWTIPKREGSGMLDGQIPPVGVQSSSWNDLLGGAGSFGGGKHD